MTTMATTTTTTTTRSLSRSWTTDCNKWWITNLRTASRKEHNYSSFSWSSKSCEKKWGSIHQQRQNTTLCVDVVFHRNFSSAGGTDQSILAPTLRCTSQTKLPTAWHYVARHDDFHCLSSTDGTRKTHYMTTGHDSGSYIFCITARPWQQTDFYTYCIF